MPHKGDSNHEHTTLSEPVDAVCLHPHVLFFLLINTLLSISMWKFISTQLTGQGLVTDHESLVV